MKTLYNFLTHTFGLKALTQEALSEFAKWLVKILFMGAFGTFYNHTNAQTTNTNLRIIHEFEASVGTRNYQLVSDLKALDAFGEQVRGGSLGFNSGNAYAQVKLKPIGFYNSNTGNSLIESSVDLAFYPLNYFFDVNPNTFNLYLTGGTQLNKLKVNGTYATDPNAQICIYQTFTANMFYWGVSGGAGAQTRVKVGDAAFRIFGEYKLIMPLSFMTSDETFKSTSAKNVSSINIGVALSIK